MGRATKILVVEDDFNILNGLVDTLESEGYEATPARNGAEALNVLKRDRFDLVLLDIMMPEKSGYDVCRDVRARDEELPIIMLTAKAEEIDKVIGLQLGADDYVTKPFGVRELLARIAAVLRRSRRGRAGGAEQTDHRGEDRFSFGHAMIDALQYKATLDNRTVDLSDREMKLVTYFHSHPNEVLRRERLLDEVWGIDYYGTTRTLDQHIAQLRKKVERDPKRPRVIKTVHGTGYRYEPCD